MSHHHQQPQQSRSTRSQHTWTPVFLLGAVGCWCWRNITVAGVVGNVMANTKHGRCSTSAGINADPLGRQAKHTPMNQNICLLHPPKSRVTSPTIRDDAVSPTREGQNTSFLPLGFQLGPTTTAESSPSISYQRWVRPRELKTVENCDCSE